MIRPRGPRTAQHLATRERPGEITIVLWFHAFLALNALAAVLLVTLSPLIPGEAPMVLAVNVPHLGLHLAGFVGLRKRTGWGFWISWVTWGLTSLGLVLGCVLSLAQPEERSFSGSLTGAITFGVFGLMFAAPFLLLTKARRRYFGMP
jgi:hypothetical protein